MNHYDLGDVVELEATFTDDDGELADPTTITLKIKDPSANVTTLTYAAAELTRESMGVYYYNLTIDEAGMWYYRWISTGTPATAEEACFYCRASQF